MGKGSDGEYGHVGTQSLPLILVTLVKYGKLPAMYNCVECVHLCNCKFDGLVLMVSLDFKTSWKMFTQRGQVCNLLQWSRMNITWDTKQRDTSVRQLLWGFLAPEIQIGGQTNGSLTSASIIDHP